MYTLGHAALFLVTVLLIAAGLYFFRRADERATRNIIRACTALLWVLEVVKILFVLLVTKSKNPNDFMPLYYCSLVLYAGLLSSLGKGRLARTGDVFLATGGLVGGACFLCCPNTSLPRYPVIHFISWHSFLLHGIMVFLGLLLLSRSFFTLRRKDIWHCVGMVSVISVISFAFNEVYNRINHTTLCNLMFLSQDFPNTPVHLVYVISGPVFPLVMWFLQAFIPYLAVYAVFQYVRRRSDRRKNRSISA